MTRHFLVAAVVALAAAPALHAQSMPMMGAAKDKANRAVAQTNAHTDAEQADQSPAPSHGQMTPITASSPAGGKPAHTMTPIAVTSAKTSTPALPAAPLKVVGHPATATPAVTTAKATPAAKGKATAVAVAAPATDSGARSISVTQRGVKGEVSLNREVFSYDPAGRRDPFMSLLRTGDLRPMLSDLRLVTVLYDPTGRNSIAVMRDISTKDQYRVKVGVTLGRMRVAQIQPRQVVFTIEEVGFSRQEPLALGDSSTARTQ